MTLTTAVVESIVSLLAGGVAGFVMGFSLTAHPDILRGVRPATTSRFLLFICRETKELNFVEGIAMLVLVLGWLVIFFALCGVPAVLAGHLGGASATLPTLGYVSFVAAWWVFRKYGAHAWRVIA